MQRAARRDAGRFFVYNSIRRGVGKNLSRAARIPQASEGFSFWFTVASSGFIISLVSANIIAVKLIQVIGLVLPAGIIVFPITYILGDVLTEVYGFNATKRVVFLGFACNLFVVVVFWVAQILPPSNGWPFQESLERIFGVGPRILLASLSAYLIGSLSNSFLMARIKVYTHGKWLWLRTSTSTVVGEGLDSLIFFLVAFGGLLPTPLLLSGVIAHWVFKTCYEILATPLVYVAVDFFKAREVQS